MTKKIYVPWLLAGILFCVFIAIYTYQSSVDIAPAPYDVRNEVDPIAMGISEKMGTMVNRDFLVTSNI